MENGVIGGGAQAKDEGPAEKHEKARIADEAERRMLERHAQAPEQAQPAAPEPHPAAEGAKVAGPQVVARIVITMYDNDAVNIEGPTEQIVLFKGLLGVAHDIASRNWNRFMDDAERRAVARAKAAASPDGKKGAMRNVFGRIGRAMSGTP